MLSAKVEEAPDVTTVEPPFRLVLPRDKRDRLMRLLAGRVRREQCPVEGCLATGISAVVLETEAAATLCPRHQLVDDLGRTFDEPPSFVTAAW